jgi:hypothetical protein
MYVQINKNLNTYMIYFSTIIILYAAYLCDSITDDSTQSGGSLEKLSTQTIWSSPTVSRPWNTWRSPGTSQKLTNAVMQGRRFSKIFNTVGSKGSYNVVVMAQSQGNFLFV